MSAVPPELPGVPRSLARSFFTISAAPVTRGLRRTYWRQGFPARRGSVCSSRVFVHAVSARGSQLLPRSLGQTARATFPDLRFSVF